MGHFVDSGIELTKKSRVTKKGGKKSGVWKFGITAPLNVIPDLFTLLCWMDPMYPIDPL